MAGRSNVNQADPRRVAAAHLYARGHYKEAGEVIFKKDRSGDAGSWAYADVAPSKREIPGDFNYSPRHQKPLALVLRSTLAALGHTLSAYNRFARLKSARLSPDGALGGRGYIQKIADMRKQYMNCVEALSALSDTLHDEINAPHWSLFSRQEDEGEKAEIEALMEDSETIRENPEEWAEAEIEEEFGDYEDEDEGEDDEEDNVSSNVALEEKTDWGESQASSEDEDSDDSELWMNPAAFNKAARARRFAHVVERVANGWVDTRSPATFNRAQLDKGIAAEFKSTSDLNSAKRNALRNLKDDPHYYEKLEILEREQH